MVKANISNGMSKKIVTHSGNFHADDVFAVASLLVIYPDAEVVRSRNPEVIRDGDIVVDVGQVYDVSIGRFDHHQPGGAGVRDDGIPYASFGLIWKEFGKQITGDKHIASIVEEKLVEPIDAIDNGVDISKPIYPNLTEYNITGIISTFLPEDDEANPDKAFSEAVVFAKMILDKVIGKARVEAKDKEELVRLAKRNGKEGALVLDRFMRGKDVLVDFPGIIFTVYPGRKTEDDFKWYIKGVAKALFSMERKKLMPSSWGGKQGSELASITGVSDALFCHKGRHLAAAKSKEGAIALAKKALEA